MLEMDPDPKMKLRMLNNYWWAAKSGRPVATTTDIGTNRVAKPNVETPFKYASSKHYLFSHLCQRPSVFMIV